MKNQLENVQTNDIAKFLEGNGNEISFGQLLDSKLLKLSDTKAIQLFFDMVNSNQIELVKSRRFPYDHALKLATPFKPSQLKIVRISKCIELYDLFSIVLLSKSSWSTFEKLTRNVFSELGICQEIKKLRLPSAEIRILFKTINGFLNGQHPLCLNDMQLKAEEMIAFSLLLSNDKNKLIDQDLIRVQVDQDGVSVRTTITKKTLSLIGNVSNYSASLKNEPVKDSLFEITYGRSIDDITLHYSDSIDSIFNDFSELSKKISKNENLSLLLHGAPGTGKTAFAQQVVKRVNGTLYQLNFSQIQSKWVGETEKNIRRVFNAYHEAWEKSTEPIILLINEADGLMNKRVTVNTSNDSFANQAQTELLEQLEKFNGILIATTNLLRNMDSAFHRRFLFKTEIHAPDILGRTNYLKNSAIYHLLDADQIETLNQSCLTIAELKNLEQKINMIQRIRTISTQDIDNLLVNEVMSKNTSKAIGYDSK